MNISAQPASDRNYVDQKQDDDYRCIDAADPAQSHKADLASYAMEI